MESILWASCDIPHDYLLISSGVGWNSISAYHSPRVEHLLLYWCYYTTEARYNSLYFVLIYQTYNLLRCFYLHIFSRHSFAYVKPLLDGALNIRNLRTPILFSFLVGQYLYIKPYPGVSSRCFNWAHYRFATLVVVFQCIDFHRLL